MPRKKAVKPKKKTKEEEFEQRMEHFGEEMGRVGEKFGKKMEEKGKGWESWFHRTFGIVGPLISGVFGIVILYLFIWIVSWVNLYMGFSFIDSMMSFFTANIGFFFLIILFLSYSSYLSKVSPRSYRPFSPIVTAVSIVIGLWILMSVINIANIYMSIPSLSIITYYIEANLIWLFGFFVLIGYIVLLLKISKENVERYSESKDVYMKKEAAQKTGVKRLFRSGKDRILGGVCGGIAEYLEVDPVIIRLLWVVLTIAALGTGIILYILFWIIIPRNPKHKWEG